MTRTALGAAARAVQRVLWIPVGYAAVVTVAGLRPPNPARRGRSNRRFAVVVPAHDEETSIETTLASLLAAEYPEDHRRVIVVADNCTDGTSERARGAGAEVWERTDPERLGKGEALRWAVARLLEDEGWDAAVVVDADTIVEPQFLAALSSRLGDGADVVQAEYRVANAADSLLTRLADLSFAVQSVLRQRGRAALGASAKLQGNGMAFSREVLVETGGWGGEGISEDVDMWFALLERGIRPQLEPGAVIAGLMPTSGDAARIQRERWEAGRVAVARRRLLPALRSAIRRRDPVLLEAAVSELVFPPLSLLAALIVAAGTARRATDGRWGPMPVQVVILGVHAAAGLKAAGAPRSSYALLALAPAVVAWKVAVKIGLTLSGGPSGWERTPR